MRLPPARSGSFLARSGCPAFSLGFSGGRGSTPRRCMQLDQHLFLGFLVGISRALNHLPRVMQGQE
jgi:hypothetical protein